MPDITPPTIISFTATGNPKAGTVVFNEPVEQKSPEIVSNYAVDNSITVYEAQLQADTATVLLTTSTHSRGITYTLTVNNVPDRTTNPNPIAPETQVTYLLERAANAGLPEGSIRRAV